MPLLFLVVSYGVAKQWLLSTGPRSMFVTAALLKGTSYEKIMGVTGQKDIKTLIRYYRNVEQYEDHAGEGLL